MFYYCVALLSILALVLLRISLEEPTGPRDGMMKELLGQLLTFDSFPNFAYMMHSSTKLMDKHGASSSRESGGAVDKAQEETLVSMGFAPELIRMVLESSEPDTPFDDIVTMLSEMGGGGVGGVSGCSGGSDSGGRRVGSRSQDIVISPRR